MDLELANKIGIVTGASQGIGGGIARQLAGEGCRLVLAARSAENLAERVAEVKDLGGTAIAHPADLRQPAAPAGVVAAALAEYGRLDFIVGSAGAPQLGDFLELSDAVWQDNFDLKFFGHLRLIRAAWPALSAAHGTVVLISGLSGRSPTPESLVGGAVNGALHNLTKGLAIKGIKDGIRVNAINPGTIRTGRHEARIARLAKETGKSAADIERDMVEKGGFTRIGEPDDIAAMVTLILSPRGSLLSGSIIDMDGAKTKTI